MVAVGARCNAKLRALGIEKLAVWSDIYQTPRTVWATSAIAALTLHAGILWWGIATWQARRPAPLPPPIRVIAVSPTALPAFAATGSASQGEASTAAVPADTSSSATTETTTPPAELLENEPVAPTPAPVEPTLPSEPTIPVAPVAPTSRPSTPPRPSMPSEGPVRPVTPPIETSASPSTPPTQTPPTQTPPIESPDPTPPPSANTPSPSNGIQVVWTRREVPGGSDLPEELPNIPAGWPEATSALLSSSGCSSGLVAPGASVRVTLWPDIEADGRISGFTRWDGGENAGKQDILNCIESLAPQFPALIPARDGGSAIASYAILIDVEIRSIP